MTDLYSAEEYPRAREIRLTLEEFVTELDDALAQTAVEKLVFGTVSLSDSGLDFAYKSEDFTRKLLVDGLLDAVELHYRPEPKANGTERDRWPDFELSNTVIPVVGEIKPLNDISAGEDQIKAYLSMADFDTPYGILTDGVAWRVYGPDRSGAGHTVREQVQLDNALQMVAEQAGIIRDPGLSSTIRNEGVTQVLEFVQTFERESFDDWTLVSLPKGKREQYIPDGYDSQASFSDFQ
jgi:hypothetical protein